VRARETAAAVAAAHGADVRLDERLREFDFGSWEGLTWDEIVARFPRAAASGRTSARDYAPDGGERFALVCDRVRAFLEDANASRASRVVAVSHAGVLHAFADVIFGSRIDAQGLFFAPASLTRIVFDADEPRLVALNDTTHLA
jgi:broad specificity phosphatase PhoE